MHVETAGHLNRLIANADRQQLLTLTKITMEAIPAVRRLPIIIRAIECVETGVYDGDLNNLLDDAYAAAEAKGFHAEVPKNLYGLAFFCVVAQNPEFSIEILRNQVSYIWTYIPFTGIDEEQLLAKTVLVLS